MQVGYARTSTAEQAAGRATQERDLAAAGAERSFSEQVSAADGKRAKLDEALQFMRDGDIFIVTEPDRLARSVADLLAIEVKLQAKAVALRVLFGRIRVEHVEPHMPPYAEYVGRRGHPQFERALMLERQREGTAKAAAEGKYKGRAPTAQVRELAAAGVGPVEIARRLEIGRSLVHRILNG